MNFFDKVVSLCWNILKWILNTILKTGIVASVVGMIVGPVGFFVGSIPQEELLKGELAFFGLGLLFGTFHKLFYDEF